MKYFKAMKGLVRWSSTSYVLLSGFLLVLFLIGCVWWPLLEELISIY